MVDHLKKLVESRDKDADLPTFINRSVVKNTQINTLTRQVKIVDRQFHKKVKYDVKYKMKWFTISVHKLERKKNWFDKFLINTFIKRSNLESVFNALDPINTNITSRKKAVQGKIFCFSKNSQNSDIFSKYKST